MGDPFPLNESSVESDLKKNTKKKTWVKEDFVFFRTRENTLNIWALKSIES